MLQIFLFKLWVPYCSVDNTLFSCPGTRKDIDAPWGNAEPMTNLTLVQYSANFKTCTVKPHVAIQMNHFGRTFAWYHLSLRILQKNVVIVNFFFGHFTARSP